jgi:hypothetical protein
LELKPVIFARGFGSISDLTVGAGDGYLYVLSIGQGAISRILPKLPSGSQSVTDINDFNTSQELNHIDSVEGELPFAFKGSQQVSEEQDLGRRQQSSLQNAPIHINSFLNNTNYDEQLSANTSDYQIL